jgi:hypothetical protein
MFHIELMDILFAVPLALFRTLLLALLLAFLVAGLQNVSLLLVLASRHVLVVINVPCAVPGVVLLVCKVRIVKRMVVARFGLVVMLSVSDRLGRVRILLRV